MRVLILGGDGYLGWPTALYLSSKGHEVVSVDNYFRRSVCEALGCEPAIPVAKLPIRAQVWRDISGIEITTIEGDVTNFDFVCETIRNTMPDTIVHYAEQPSAPYSMRGYQEAKHTLTNNLVGTFNVAYAVKEIAREIHIVKLGTMGEYGTPNIDIEEGFIEILHKGRSDRLLFPRQASSLYHTTKILDTDLLYFFVRLSGLKVTDLMQGPVYGLMIPEMKNDLRLATFFNYDNIFGTVLNRFLVQAVINTPLTVYGSGGQIRGYLNLIDTLQCIGLAIDNPPNAGELKILNQYTEIFSVLELAEKVVDAADAIGISAEIRHQVNPRIEKEDHYYNPTNSRLLDLGLTPHLLDRERLIEMIETILRVKDRLMSEQVQQNVQWN
jgi:UDP-sulfoquinovose synthase